MPRYILIDDLNGCVFADSADVPAGPDEERPEEFAKRFEELKGQRGCTYEMLASNPRALGEPGFDVYQSDSDAELLPLPDTESIEETILATCRYLGFVRVREEFSEKARQDLDEELRLANARQFEPPAFIATHTLVLGNGVQIPVRLVEGACYTQLEWEACIPADWEYSEQDGLTFQGKRPAGNCYLSPREGR